MRIPDMSVATTYNIGRNLSTEAGFIDISCGLRSSCSNTPYADNRMHPTQRGIVPYQKNAGVIFQ